MLARGREAQARASPDTVLSPLPHWFVHAVLLLLPVDTRLRCCEVSRAWRALLADTTLWTRISLRASTGVARFSEALLRAAVAKAGGQLRALDITGQPVGDIRRFMLVQDPLARLVREIVAQQGHADGAACRHDTYMDRRQRARAASGGLEVGHG